MTGAVPATTRRSSAPVVAKIVVWVVFAALFVATLIVVVRLIIANAG